MGACAVVKDLESCGKDLESGGLFETAPEPTLAGKADREDACALEPGSLNKVESEETEEDEIDVGEETPTG